MRIVSQNGRDDLNYDNISISLGSTLNEDSFSIIATVDYTAKRILLAEYKTEAKAQSELKRMRDLYSRVLIETAPNQNIMTDSIEAEMDKPFNAINIKYLPNNIVFIFSEDE